MNWFKRAHIRYILHRHPIAHQQWQDVTEKMAVFQGLTAVEKAHLRELATLFLHEKKLLGVQGQEVTDAMRVVIAALACLPVLGLGFGCLEGWTEVIVYPSAFRVRREERDDAGVVHHQERSLSGESWSRGPLIVSWDDIEQDLRETRSVRNVVIHEIAHKLDMLNGPADGYPPLRYGMPVAAWSTTLSAAYQKLVLRVEHHHRTCIDPYAAANPAEFFAVISEYFFCAPDILHAQFAAVYEQLRLYYRQDPLTRTGRYFT
ncbi:M90 family metallopeptidase [Methylomicrobium sp. Wu6]|uniref:M90 family metallopeptidase n=1 Tax=Methylomicrobium sp. Wu6 TaxID=3107928 RepID=UPI002DD68A5D|nr:M90 family metallopeptidase [Methylomicrobium sp. Wu6]MEC4747479.1 M90 family metallopeptidase [Methylomicrobium sp. Wu6]